MKSWEQLPREMQLDEVRPYYDSLKNKSVSLLLKRIFDLLLSIVLIIILAIPMIAISVMIKIDSPGPVLYRQERVTTYGRIFRIHKFRTMVVNADKIGAHVTVNRDSRITKVGEKLRSARLDELPQLFDVLKGDMSFVGTRPEAKKYVEAYTSEMMATLLLPAGITSEASVAYKDEAKLLEHADDVDSIYISVILPEKMKYNLDSINNFSVINEIKTMFKTIGAIIG